MKKRFYKACKSIALMSLTAFMLVSQFSTTVYATEDIDPKQDIIEEPVTIPAQDDVVVLQQVQPAQNVVPEEDKVPEGNSFPEENPVPAQSTEPVSNIQNPADDTKDENKQELNGQNNADGQSGDNAQNNGEGQITSLSLEPEYTLVENEEQLREALKKGGAIKLTQDITVQQGWVKVGSGLDGVAGKDETILNLDGKTITVAQSTATFAVDEGKSLTVLNGTVTGQQESEDVGAAFECNNGSSVSLQGVTVSKLNNAVFANNAQLKIENCNFTDNSNKTNGGAIFATGSTLTTLGNNTFSGNKAKVDGGAIYAEKSVFLSDAETKNSFTDNTAGLKGGAISLRDFEDDLVLSQMTFTNNSSYQDGWGSGGGAIYYKGQKNLTVDQSNTFANNYALSSGGAILFEGNELYINGTYSGNIAEKHEGGAIAIIGNFRGGNNSASLESGLLEGNKTGYDKNGNPNESYQDWGGGAIFVSDASSIVVPSETLITGNTAGGFGGGLAGCSTGRVFVFGDDDSLAMVFNNKGGDRNNIHVSGEGSAKHDDHTYAEQNPTFMESGYDDYFCALNSIVEKSVFGGADVKGSVDQSQISEDDSLYVASYVMGITAQLVGDDALQKAKKDALVKIINNESYTHGGGILSNGYMIVGNPRANAISVGKSLQISATKALFTPEGEQLSMENRVYSFSVTDENGEKVLSGMNDSQGQIGFSGKISFNQKNFTGEGDSATYNYFLAEDEVEDSNVIRDETKYRLEVKVHKNATAQKVGGKEFSLDKYEIEKVSIYRISDGTETLMDESDYSFKANDEMHAALISFLGTNRATFNNILKPEDPVDPEDPEDPVDPVDPADPVDPIDPDDLIDPVDPVDPEDPVDPIDPATPVDPVDPVDPIDPVDPVTPEDPADPVVPVSPAEPAQTENPSSPQEPVTFEIPDGEPVALASEPVTLTGEPVALASEPVVMGASRSADLPEVLGARRGVTSDDAMGYIRVVIIIMAAAAALIMAIQKKKD
ncbi:right-handed parallel beta-helix repeat-containing protein [Butyrivibrio sp. XPD2006]|uniref:right-handed parallel beta-helix repeat-containing protein n=1 Tax=Butyrivibrio sp. XPD2006 TaxID=1280668 RepID=UPI0003B6018E|nr:right-handed parallel beta-helix repeat-containing protein [Butyrivibrio sp. XPD2006]